MRIHDFEDQVEQMANDTAAEKYGVEDFYELPEEVRYKLWSDCEVAVAERYMMAAEAEEDRRMSAYMDEGWAERKAK